MVAYTHDRMVVLLYEEKVPTSFCFLLSLLLRRNMSCGEEIFTRQNLFSLHEPGKTIYNNHLSSLLNLGPIQNPVFMGNCP